MSKSFFSIFRRQPDPPPSATKERKQRVELGKRLFHPEELIVARNSFDLSGDQIVSYLNKKWKLFQEESERVPPDTSKSSNLLRDFISSFNPRYKQWHSEFEAMSAFSPNLTTCRRHWATPIIDSACAKHLRLLLEQFKNNFCRFSIFIKDDLNPLRGCGYAQNILGMSESFHVVYSVNILCRHPQNVDLLGRLNFLKLILELLQNSAPLLCSLPPDIKEEGFGHLPGAKTSRQGDFCTGHSPQGEDLTPENFVQVLFATCLQIVINMTGQHNAWRQYFFQTPENQNKIKQDDKHHFSKAKKQAREGKLLSLLHSQLGKFWGVSGALVGSQHDFVLLLLEGMGSLCFNVEEGKKELEEGGVLETLVSWIRWPSTIKALSLPSGEGKGEGEGEKEGEGEGEGEVLEEETGYFREKEQIGTEGKNRTI